MNDTHRLAVICCAFSIRFELPLLLKVPLSSLWTLTLLQVYQVESYLTTINQIDQRHASIRFINMGFRCLKTEDLVGQLADWLRLVIAQGFRGLLHRAYHWRWPTH